MQGLLEALDVAYVGAGVLASAICIDKLTFKRLLDFHGIPQVALLRRGRGGVARAGGQLRARRCG